MMNKRAASDVSDAYLVISFTFWRNTLETSVLLCALMCLSSVNIIFICIIMFYQIN